MKIINFKKNYFCRYQIKEENIIRANCFVHYNNSSKFEDFHIYAFHPESSIVVNNGFHTYVSTSEDNVEKMRKYFLKSNFPFSYEIIEVDFTDEKNISYLKTYYGDNQDDDCSKKYLKYAKENNVKEIMYKFTIKKDECISKHHQVLIIHFIRWLYEGNDDYKGVNNLILAINEKEKNPKISIISTLMFAIAKLPNSGGNHYHFTFGILGTEKTNIFLPNKEDILNYLVYRKDEHLQNNCISQLCKEMGNAPGRNLFNLDHGYSEYLESVKKKLTKEELKYYKNLWKKK